MDPLSNKRQRRRKNNRDVRSLSNKCEEQWVLAHATSMSKSLRHKEACETLDSHLNFTLENEFKCNNETSSNEVKPHSDKTPL